MSYLLPFGILATFFYLFSLFLGDFLLGKFTNIKSNELSNSPQFSSFVGIVIIVSCFSIFYTGFKSVNIFVILLLIAFLINNYDKEAFNRKINYKGVFLNTLIFLGLFILVSFFHLVAFNENLDILYYGGMVSKGLYETGVENSFGYYNEYLPSELSTNTTPYHFFELWMTVLFKHLSTGFSFIMVLKYLVYVFLETYIISALYSMLKGMKVKVNFFLYIAIILITAFPLNLVLGFFNNSWHAFQFDFWNYPNFIIYSFVIVNVISFFIKGDFKNGLFLFLILPVMSITTAPAVLTTVFVVTILFYYFKYFKIKETLFLLLSSVILACLIFVFYKLTSSPIEAYIENDTSLLMRYKNAWKAILYILGVVNVIIFLFLGILFFYNKGIKGIETKILNKILLICLVAVSSGVFLYQLVFYVENSYQFVYVGYNFIFIIFILLVLKGLFSVSKLKYISYVVMLISCVSLFYSVPSTFSMNDLRYSEFSYYEEFNIKVSQKKSELLLNKKRKVIVVLTKETLPYIRSFTYRVPMSGLFFMGDYSIITMVDEKVLYSSVEGRSYDEGYDRAKLANSILPKEWFDLKNIDITAKNEDVLFVAIPINDSLVRNEIKLKVEDSINVSNYKLLFFNKSN